MLSNPNPTKVGRKRLTWYLCACLVALLLGLGAFARNGWFPSTDPMSGERTGWFGAKLAKNAPSSWNPLAAPLPSVTPQLSKENIYAGGRLLAVEDKNANAAPPADLAVYRPGSSGAWYVMGPGGSIADSAGWGTTNDIPAPGDYDGDGKVDFCVWRPSTGAWYIIYSNNSSTAGFGFGTTGDKPVPADFDGDGKSDPAVFRASNNTWYWLTSSNGYGSTLYQALGTSGDVPVPADYDGDGKADVSVWRSSNATFYTLRSSDASTQYAGISFSGYTVSSSDAAVPCDYDGDGKANYAIRNGSSWLMLTSTFSNMTVVTPSGDTSGDKPVPADYDADGKCDIAVWRDSNGDWYIRKSGSSDALRQDHWGQNGDIPLPAYWRR